MSHPPPPLPRPPEPPIRSGTTAASPSDIAPPFRPVLADPVLADAAAGPPPLPTRRGLIGPVIGFGFRVIFGALGIVTLIFGLAIVATVPVLQFLSLGYLLEVSGRIGRTGRLREGFIGLTPAGVAGVFLAGFGIIWLILRYLSSMAINAQLIAPGTDAGKTWGFFAVLGVGALTAAALGLFLIVQFFRPATYTDLRDGLWRLVTNRVPYYFWLGLRGFIGGMVWLAVPVSLLAAASLVPDADRPGMRALSAILRISGSISLMVVILHVPFLQTRMAAQNRLREVFAWRAVREQFRKAPIAFWLSAAITLLFALPLYLLKIEFVPADAAWLPSVLFVTLAFPARLLTGWAYARSQRETRRHWTIRWLVRLAMVPVAAFYVLIVFFSQFTVWHGVWGMYEQHAFLLPVPFLGG